MSEVKKYNEIVEYLEEHESILLRICEEMGDAGISPFNDRLYSFNIDEWWMDCGSVEDFANELLDSGICSYELGQDFRRNYNDEVVVYDDSDIYDEVITYYMDDIVDWLESKCPLDKFDYIPKELADLFVENTHRVTIFEGDKLVCHITDLVGYDRAKSISYSLTEICGDSLYPVRRFVVTENGMEVFGEPSEVTINV